MCRYAQVVGDTDAMPARAMTEDQWSGLGFHDVDGLGGGWQSRVFSARSGNQRLAVKLTQAELVDRDVLERRMAMVAELAALDSSVVAPVPVAGRLVYPFGDWLITATSYVEGEQLDQALPAAGDLLGAALAELHRSMRQLPTVRLPRVAALAAGSTGRWTTTTSDQMLHGDFAASNTVLSPHGLRVLDFDDCGYGPIEFDVANSLYMVMFDTWSNGRPQTQYADFRAAFTSGYSAAAGRVVAASNIDPLITIRVIALKKWISDPVKAPIGIRNSPPEWIETLHRFVHEWDNQEGSPTP